MWNRSFLGLLILILLFILVSALGAAEPAAPAPAIDLSGAWSGSWQSCTSGHNGPLHASFCKVCDDAYQVRFRGRFWRIFPFHYTVTLNVVGREGDKLLLAGSADLGRLFGTFHYEAEATACAFHATYRSCKDHGTFCLLRVCDCP